MLMKTVSRIDVLSCARMNAIVTGFIGGVIAALYALMILLGGLAMGRFAYVLIGLAVIIFVPLLYGLVGFVFGALIAAVYNLVAKKFGGIKIELK